MLVRGRAQGKRDATADSPDRRRTLAENCTELQKRYAKEAKTTRGCDWSSAAPIGKASQQLARAHLADARAVLLAPGEPPRDSARRHPWIVAKRSIVSMDRIPSVLRKAVEQAAPGQPSEPIEGDGVYWIVRVDERWPAGSLPLEARRDEFTDAARARLAARVTDELPLRLREGHEIVMYRYETEARALLGPQDDRRDAFVRTRHEPAVSLFELLDAK